MSRFVKLSIASDGTPSGTKILDATTGEDLGAKLGVARAVCDLHAGGVCWLLELSPNVEVEYQAIGLSIPGPFTLLPKADWQIQERSSGDFAAGIWEFPIGVKAWIVIDAADLPNDLITT